MGKFKDINLYIKIKSYLIANEIYDEKFINVLALSKKYGVSRWKIKKYSTEALNHILKTLRNND